MPQMFFCEFCEIFQNLVIQEDKETTKAETVFDVFDLKQMDLPSEAAIRGILLKEVFLRFLRCFKGFRQNIEIINADIKKVPSGYISGTNSVLFFLSRPSTRHSFCDSYMS